MRLSDAFSVESASQFHGVAREILRRHSVACARCNGEPRLEYEQQQRTIYGQAVVIRARCHGEYESSTYVVEDRDIESSSVEERMRRFVEWLPKRWFLRNWAGYTIRTRPGEGRQM